MSQDERSKRMVALVLALIGPWGLGHFFLGRRARGAAWLAVPTLGLLVGFAALPAIGPKIGYGVVTLLPLLWMLVAWIGSIVDLLLMGPSQDHAPVWQTVLFACGGVFATLAIALSLRIFFIEAFRIPASSMSPALLDGDHIFVDKRTRAAEYGDVMVFAFPENPDQDFVKRVIGRPGDVLDMKQGRPHINGWRVPSCIVARSATIGDVTGQLELEFLGASSYLVIYDERGAPSDSGPLFAKDGYLVLGDNRNNSHDSRMWFGGAGGDVPPENMRGRALYIWLRQSPIDSTGFGTPVNGPPRLPSSLASLKSDLDRCIAARPAKTTP